MKDFISNNTGNSRFLKSVSNFLELYPDYATFAAALVSGTLPIDLNGVNPYGYSQLGTPLNKATFLKDATAALLELSGDDPTVDDALATIASKISAEIVSYTGTGTYGSNNPCSITFSKPVDVVFYLGWIDTGDGVRIVIQTAMANESTSYQYNHGFGQTNSSGSLQGKRSSDNKTLTWYSTGSANDQLNALNVTYYFVGFRGVQ